MTRRVAVRADANHQIGGGHMMRCIRLLSAFDGQGVETILITHQRTLDDFSVLTQAFDKVEVLGDAFDLSSFETALKNQAPLDAIIFDHYELCTDYERTAKPYAGSLIALDDLERFHDVDVLFHFNMSLDQDSLKACARKDSLMFNDPCYFPLDKAFEKTDKWSLQSSAKSIFMCFGYDDPKLFSAKILDALCGYQGDLSVTLIMGQDNQDKIADTITKFQTRHELTCLHALDASELADVMSEADFAIGVGGGNIYERAALGHPSIVFEYADNQRPNINYFENKNAIINAGKMDDFSSENFLSLFTDVFNDEIRKKELSENSLHMMGENPRHHLDEFLKQSICGDLHLRQATVDDTDFIYSLQDAETRKFYKTTEAPAFEDHKSYMARRVLKPMSFFIMSNQGKDAGFIRFDADDGIDYVSIAVAPHCRGQGLARKALMQGLSLVPNRTIGAEIHKDNASSIHLFKSAGFEEQKRDKTFIQFLKDN